MRVRIAMFAALFGLLAAYGQELHITSGPADNQVLQRDADETGRIALTGTASGKKVDGKEVEARLLDARATDLPGFHWTRLGKIQKLHWNGELTGIPAGGPYRLEVRMLGVESSVVSVSNLLVGDLWVLAGQSNMEGHGDLVDVQSPAPLVRSFDMADRWRQAEEPLHTAVSAVDPVHWPLNAQNQPERLAGQALETYLANRKKGAGLGLPFAAEMVARTGGTRPGKIGRASRCMAPCSGAWKRPAGACEACFGIRANRMRTRSRSRRFKRGSRVL
jgi:sialate O-acetylesterase